MPDQGNNLVLRGGDLIVFPRDIKHYISSSQAPGKIPDVLSPPSAAEGDRPATSLICGYFDFDSPLANPILDAMPDVVHIKNEDPAKTSMLDSILRFITQETENAQAGADVIVDRLSEVLFIHVIRAYIQQSGVSTGLLAALSDIKLGPVIQSIHQNPGYKWSVDNLAEKATMSRSAFANHFQAVTGITPMQYVTNWRMQTAFERLRTGKESVAWIAEHSGYQTEASFRKAFKKQMGMAPGAIRKDRLPLG